jgi:hypothetical protein
MSTNSQLITSLTSTSPTTLTNISDILNPLPRIIQLTTILHFFQHLQELNSNLAQTLTLVWDYLLQNNLWQEQFPTLLQFKTFIHFEKDILPLLRFAKTSSQRVHTLRETIFTHWAVYPEEAIPPTIRPTSFSEHILRELATLSKYMDLSTARSQLIAQVSARLNTSNSQSILKSSDVLLLHTSLRTIQPRRTRTSISPYVHSLT